MRLLLQGHGQLDEQDGVVRQRTVEEQRAVRRPRPLRAASEPGARAQLRLDLLLEKLPVRLRFQPDAFLHRRRAVRRPAETVVADLALRTLRPPFVEPVGVVDFLSINTHADALMSFSG